MAIMSNYALRMPKSLLEEVRKLARDEGTSVNQLINVAVAEKLGALRTEAYFAERRKRADFAHVDRLLERTGGEPPRPGDEIPEGWWETAPPALKKHRPKSRKRA
jgi:hypothetical protein